MKTVKSIFVISICLFVLSCGKASKQEEVVYDEPVLAEDEAEELENTQSHSETVSTPEYHFQEILSYADLRKKLNYLDGKGFVSHSVTEKNIVLRLKMEEAHISINKKTYPQDDEIHYYKPLGNDDPVEKLNYIGEYSVNKDTVSLFTLDNEKDTLMLNVLKYETFTGKIIGSRKEFAVHEIPSVRLLSTSPFYDFIELQNESKKDFFLKALVSYDFTYKSGKLIYFIHFTGYEKSEGKAIFAGEMSEYLKYEKVNLTPQDMVISMATGDMVPTAVEKVKFIYELPPHDRNTIHTLTCRQGFAVDLEVSLDGNDKDGYTFSGKAKSGGKEWDLKAVQHSPIE